MYSVVSAIQQSDSVLYVYIHTSIYFVMFSIIVYYRILNIVPCAIQ